MPVMVAAGDDPQLVFGDFVHETMFFVDASRPQALELVPQGFGLADTFERFSLNVLLRNITAVLSCNGPERSPQFGRTTAAPSRLSSSH